MTVSQLLAMADELVPNPFSTAVKLFEFNRLEHRIRVDILQEDPDDVEQVEAGDLATTDLTLEDRYQDVYLGWMKAQLYWLMGEYDIYQNEKAMFDAAWLRFERDICMERHMGTGGPELETEVNP